MLYVFTRSSLNLFLILMLRHMFRSTSLKLLQKVPDEVGWSGLMATILFNLLWLCPKLQAVEVMVLTLNNFLLWGIHVRSTRRRHCKHRR